MKQYSQMEEAKEQRWLKEIQEWETKIQARLDLMKEGVKVDEAARDRAEERVMLKHIARKEQLKIDEENAWARLYKEKQAEMRKQLANQVHEKRQKEKLEMQNHENYVKYMISKNKKDIDEEKQMEKERKIKEWENLKEI